MLGKRPSSFTFRTVFLWEINVKHFLLLLSLCLISLPAAAAEKPTIGVLIKSPTYEFWKTFKDATEEYAKKNDMDVFVMGSLNANDAQEQLNLCESMLLKKPDAMIVGADNLTNLQSCLKKASTQKIPVIDVDGNITKETSKEYNLDVKFSVAADNKLLGQKAAEYLRGRTGKVLILEGLPGSLPSILRKEGFVEHLPEGLEVVASLPTDWSRLKAADITADILLKHPDLKIIFSVADAMAFGAYEAAKQANKTEGLTIIGVDANADAIQSIREGKMAASVAQLPTLMAQEALDKTQRYLKGEKFEYEQFLPTVVVTKEMLEKNEDPVLQYIPH